MHPLTLRCLVPALLFASTIVPKTAMATASAELYTLQSYLYGRFEARLRFGSGNGVIGSFFLWKNGSDVAGTFWNEVDFEELGVDCHMQSNVIYGLPKANHEQNPIPGLPNTLCTAYHDYRIEWTPDYLAWSVDGREVRRETGATALAFSQNATAGMTFHFSIWPGNNNFGGTLNPAILPVRHFISWVQYSSLVNGAFQLQWREEFDSPTLPVDWAAADWASPFALSVHNPLNISFLNGIGILSMTADNAIGSVVVPPVDPTAGAVDAGIRDAGTVGTGTGGTGTVDAAARDGAARDAATGGGAGGASTGTGAGGGTGGAGGAATGGVGAGGATTSGAATGTTGTGGVATGSTGAGGAATGGATTGGSAKGGGGANAARNQPPDAGGCSCRLVGRPVGEPSSVWLAMLGLSLLRRRRDGTSARCGRR
jgi:endo-1,3-1,4-beta-glycanase ExoK